MPQAYFTAEQLLSMPQGQDRRELVRGELRNMSPAGWLHGAVAARVARLLGNHVEMHQLGIVFAAETGCHLQRDPDTVRAADVAFVARQRLAGLRRGPGFFPGAPDLAVEVLSPSDTAAAVRDKVASWLDAGCALVWVIDPLRRCAEVHRPGAAMETVAEDGVLAGEAIVPGLAMPLRDALLD